MMSFEAWWQELVSLAVAQDFPLNVGEPESYQDYFDDGDSPEDALQTEMDACDV